MMMMTHDPIQAQINPLLAAVSSGAYAPLGAGVPLAGLNPLAQVLGNLTPMISGIPQTGIPQLTQQPFTTGINPQLLHLQLQGQSPWSTGLGPLANLINPLQVNPLQSQIGATYGPLASLINPLQTQLNPWLQGGIQAGLPLALQTLAQQSQLAALHPQTLASLYGQLGSPLGQIGQIGLPYGLPQTQQFGSPFGQQFGSPYGQIGQQFGSPLGQIGQTGLPYGLPQTQQFGSPFGQIGQLGLPYALSALHQTQPFGSLFGSPFASQLGLPFGSIGALQGQIGSLYGQPHPSLLAPQSWIGPIGQFGGGYGHQNPLRESAARIL